MMAFTAMLSELYGAFRRKVGADEPPAKAVAEAVVIEDTRFRSIDRRFDALSRTMDERFDALSQRFDMRNVSRCIRPNTDKQQNSKKRLHGISHSPTREILRSRR